MEPLKITDQHCGPQVKAARARTDSQNTSTVQVVGQPQDLISEKLLKRPQAGNHAKTSKQNIDYIGLHCKASQGSGIASHGFCMSART